MVETNLDSSGNPTGEWTKTDSDTLGNTAEIIYADGSHSLSYYNSVNQLVNQVDPDGVSTLYQYDDKGQVAYTAIDVEQTGTIDWGGADRITWTTNDVTTDSGTAVNRTRTYIWLDGQSTGTLASVSETSVDGLKSWQTSYGDASTALTSQTVTSYSGTNRTVTSTAPDGSYTINAYASGQLMSSVRYDANNHPLAGTSYKYDAHGRQYQVTDARNGTTSYGYNPADQVAAVTTPPPGNGLAQTTTTLYDTMLRPYEVIQPDGTTVSNAYLLTGELALQSGSRTYPVAYGYDYAGRMQTMTNWSSFGSLAGARVTTWIYDGQRGWLNSKTYADGNGPSYTYTAAGRLLSRTWVRTDGSGNPITTTYAYDTAGGLINTLYSDGTPCVTNGYNRLGQLVSVVCNGMTDSLTYNLAGQLLGESISGGPLDGLSVTNGYDQFMRRTSLTLNSQPSTTNRTTYGYDAASRLQTVNDGHGDTVSYNYLANSPLVSQITFAQSSATRMTTTKQYDYLNRLTAISSQPGAAGVLPVSFNYNYNSANQRIHDKLADGSYWVYQYDSLGQVISGIKYFSDGTLVPGQQFDYSFDTIGNRTQTQAGGDTNGANLRVANYWVNSLNQITNRDYPGTNDIIGVALATNSVQVNGQTAWQKWEYFHGTVGANNAASPAWLTATVASGGATNTGNLFIPQTPEQFSYDADGNLTNDGRWAYTWDAENRLIGMVANTTVGPQYQLAFVYDAKGRRIQKVVTNGSAVATTNFLYDGWNLVAELQPNNTLVRSYVWGSDLSGSMQGAGGVGGLLEVSYYGGGTSPTNYFAAFDGNGNVAALVSATNGSVVANYEYGPFGEVIRATGPMAKANPIRFSTKYDDDESDLLYYGYRYYKLSNGAWLNRDFAAEGGGINLYCLVNNDPISRFDMLGLWDTDQHHALIETWLKNRTPPGEIFPDYWTHYKWHCFEINVLADLQKGSDNVDGVGQGMLGFCEAQSSALSYQHSMRAYWQTVAEAKSKRDSFVLDKETQAVENAVYAEIESDSGSTAAAWDMDQAVIQYRRSSPSNRGRHITPTLGFSGMVRTG